MLVQLIKLVSCLIIGCILVAFQIQVKKLRNHIIIFGLFFVASATSAQTITKIAFGSCSNQNLPQPILELAANKAPDLFIYLGDNIYGDTEDMSIMKSKYDRLGAKEEFQKLKDTCTLIATWDDHDYGGNDLGCEYPMKAESKEVFLDFWGEPEDSERRKHEGIYTSYMYGDSGKRVQVIVLDCRTFRTKLKRSIPLIQKRHYAPNKKTGASILGSEQWEWLGKELEKDADIRIIASGIQFGIRYNGWEAWANFPNEQKKLLNLIKEKKANGVMVISGDVHYAEISELENEGAYPIIDVTSSGITQKWHTVAKNKNRLYEACRDNNFGLIEIDWEKPTPEISMSIIDVKDTIRIQHTISLKDLAF